MSKKISEMTPTGEAPATSELALAYNGDNYKINPADLVNSVPASGAGIPTTTYCGPPNGDVLWGNVTGIRIVPGGGGYSQYFFLMDHGGFFGFSANTEVGSGPNPCPP
jgi:hypothetical protein